MTIYSIGDLHLSAGDKPMDVFGPHWARHFDRISQDWRARVGGEDIVLIPGDISWAMRLAEAAENISAIAALPGRKVMIRGNHDFWWSAIGRVRGVLPDGFYAIQNDCVAIGGVLIAGTRGWILPADAQDENDLRVYEREVLRLEMSLGAARKIDPDAPLYAMLHYPPLTDKQRDTEFTRLFEAYRCNHVVYGHLHGHALKNAFHGEHRGIFYHQTSCDGLDFKLYRLPNPDE